MKFEVLTVVLAKTIFFLDIVMVHWGIGARVSEKLAVPFVLIFQTVYLS